MKWVVAMMFTCLLAGQAVQGVAQGQELSQRALKYFVGSWEGSIASEEDMSPRLGNIGTARYSGTGKMTTDGESLLQIGGWSRVGVSGGVGWARYYKPGSEPNTLVIYVYSTNADHAIVHGTVKPRGNLFEIVGEKSGVTPGRELTTSQFNLVAIDEDRFSIKNTSRTLDGEERDDEVLMFVRKK